MRRYGSITRHIETLYVIWSTNFIPYTVKTTIYGHYVALSKTDAAVHKTQYGADNRTMANGFHYISLKLAGFHITWRYVQP